MARYAMVILGKLCTGCQTCSVACKMENLTLPGCARTHITERIDATWEIGMCMQCEDPPCVAACPADATSKNELGVIVIDQEACIGCGRCVEACPYNARHINLDKGYFEKPLPFEEMAKKAKEAHRHHVAGKADKCDWCLHRIALNRAPMCVEACTTGARVFGDRDDPKSPVSKLIKDGARPLKPELGTGPNIFYL